MRSITESDGVGGGFEDYEKDMSRFHFLDVSRCYNSVNSNPCLIIPFFYVEFLTCDGVFRICWIKAKGR